MKKRLLSIFLVLTMVFSLVPAMSITASAETAVTYRYAVYNSGQSYNGVDYWDEASITDYTLVTDGTNVTWEPGYYVVKGTDVKITDGLTCNSNADIHLILCDGAKLTVTGKKDGYTAYDALTVNGSLYVYGQAEGTGILNIVGEDGDNGSNAVKMANVQGDNLTIFGGNVFATGGNGTGQYGNGGAGVYNGVTINGGSLTAKGGNGGTEGIGNAGMLEGFFIANGGTLTAIGGTGFSGAYVNIGIKQTTGGAFYPNGVRVEESTDGADWTTWVAGGSQLFNKQYVRFEPVAQITSGEKAGVDFKSLTEAIGMAYTDGSETKIKLLADTQENVTIPAGRNITLDLNGYVLDGDGKGSVIVNNGTLTVTDGAANKTTRYFTDAKCEHGVTIGETCSRSNSSCKENNNTAIADDCYETYTTIKPESMSGVLTVVGGCITGGNAENGGGINNSGTLYLKGGNIVGNLVPKAKNGGGVYNSGTFEMSSGVILGNASFYVAGGVYNGGTFKMTGGSITGNTAKTCGGGVGTYGTFTMSAGTISGNKTKDGFGAGVGVSNGSFTMEGGEISGNSALGDDGYGGGVCCDSATFTMKNGEISGNTANYGGGVYNQSVVNLTGGRVTGNTATTAGGGVLHWGEDSCTLGGAVQITGNTVSGNASNLAIMVDIALGTGEDVPTTDMNVGVTVLNEEMESTSGPFTTNGTEADKQYFFSDNSAYSVKYVAATTGEPSVPAHLALAEKTVCKIGDTEYASIDAALKHGGTDASDVPEGEKATTPTVITLIDDDTENVTISAWRNINLDLNGYVLSAPATGGSVITVEDTYVGSDKQCAFLKITDSSTDAQSHYFKVDASGLWQWQKDFSGTETYTFDSSIGLQKNGLPSTDVPAENAVIKVTGGCITGGTGTGDTDTRGGGIYNIGKLMITGGSIVGNAANSGGGVYTGTEEYFTMTGGSIVGNTASSGGGVSYKSRCFIAGTQITIADGSTKRIENVAVGELVRSYNHETGKFENNKVTIAYEGESAAPYFTLHFTNGVDLSICGCHDLFEQSACRYVTVSPANCETMIGKYFYNAADGTWEKLLSVTRPDDTAKYYSLYVAKTVNCLANGMLSVPDDIDPVVNMFTFGADLTVDQTALQADIEKYGLCTPADFPYIDTQEEFDALNCRYFDIMAGKGLVTREEAEAAYREWYADDTEEPIVRMAKSVQMNAPLMTAVSLMSNAGETPSLGFTLGGTAKITANADSNLYLESGNTVMISTTAAPTTMSVGVTLSTGTGAFTTNGKETDKQYFFSDNDDYFVKFVGGDTAHLELAVKPSSRITQQPTYANGYEVLVDTTGLTGDTTYQWMVMADKAMALKDSGLVIDHENGEAGMVVAGENKINAEYVSWEAGQGYDAGSDYEIYFKLPEGTKQVTFTVDSLDGLYGNAETRDSYGVTIKQNGEQWECTYPYDSDWPYFVIWHSTQTFTISNVKFVVEAPATFADTDNILTGGESGKTYYCAVSYPDGFSENSYKVTVPHTHGTGESAVIFETPITTEAELKALFTDGGSGCLYANISLLSGGLSVAENKTVSLCLNGHTVNLNKHNISVKEGAVLKIYDCAEGATKGTITNGETETNGGAFDVSGSLYLYGGIIDSCKAGQHGGGVFLRSGSSAGFYMYGGTIQNCSTNSGKGGGVNCEYGTFHMYGGTITGNRAQDAYGQGGCGGGVHNGASAASFHMHGGTITGNHAVNYGGGIYNQLDTSFDGKCIVRDNYSYGGNKEMTDANKVVDNLYTSVIVSIGAGGSAETYTGKGALQSGSEIGVTLSYGSGAVTKGNGTTDYSMYFVSDNPKYEALNDTTDENNQFVKLGLNVVAQVIDTAGTVVSEHHTVQLAIDAATSGQTVRMLKNSTENVTVESDDNITLNLNGHVLKGTGNGSVITNNGTLTITDTDTTAATHNFKVDADGLWTLTDAAYTKTYDSLSVRSAVGDVIAVTGGVITGGTGTKETNYNRGGGIYNNGSLMLEGGNVIGNAATGSKDTYGGGIYNKGTFTMKNGIVAGNIAKGTNSSNGGGVHNDAYSTNMIMRGGSITDNSANQGGGVSNSNILTIKSGSVLRNFAVHMGGGVLNECDEFNMEGGIISDNVTNGMGGGVMQFVGSANLGGTANICDNSALLGNNMLAVMMNVGSGTDGNGVLKPTEGMHVGVSLLAYDSVSDSFFVTSGAFTTNGTSSDAQYFTSDSLAYKVKFNNNGTDTDTTDDYLELVNYDINAVTSNTASITLEKNDMTSTQAIAIAKVQKSSITKSTAIVYAKGSSFATDSKYSVITSNNGSTWATGTAMTLDAMKADLANADYFVIGSVTNHAHAWSYSLKSGATDTIEAACNGSGTCDSTANKTLTIVAPTAPTYDGTAKAVSIKDSKTSLGGISELPAIQYQKKTGESTYDTATTTAPTDVGSYKVSITVGEGDKAVTAYVEYTIAPKQLTISGTTVAGKTYDGTAAATATAGTLSGVVSGDTGKVTVSIQSAEFADKNAGADNTVTVKYSISGTAAANYLAPADDSDFTATISQKPLAISTESGKSTTVSGKTYDGTTTASATIGTVVGIETGDSVTVAVNSATFDTKDVGTGKSVAVVYKISGTDAGNYVKPEDETKTASITAKPVNVTADNKNSYVGSNLVTLTYTVDTTTPLVSGEALTGALATDADKDVVGSAYQITQGTLTNANNPNYSITFTAGTYTVKALETQTLSFPDGNQTKTYGDAPFTKTVSGASTTVTYESSDPTVATVNASTGEVAILKEGMTTITAKAAASATYASAEASYTLTVNNASQSAPNAGKTDETIKGKADGKLTGVTDAMEYRKAADSTYTAITGTEVTGLAVGEYKVRYAAKTNYDASPDQTLTIAAGSTLTLTFDAKGGTAADPIPGLTWQATVTLPETTKTGYTFRKWNTNEAGTGSTLTAATKIEASDTYYAIWHTNSYTVTFHPNNGTGTMESQSFTYDAAQTLTANAFIRSGFNFTGWAKTADAKYAEYLDGAPVKNLTAAANGNIDLYAVWTAKPVYSVSGRVQQEKVPTPENVPNALVELKQGQDVIATTRTDANGNYAFTGIESGEYNIVVTGHASGTQDKTKTTLILVENENKTGVNVLLPQGNVSSVVEVKDNTPQIIAGGLDEEAVKQAGSNLSDTIRLVLTVESVEDVTSTPGAPTAEVAAQTAIKQKASGKTVDFIDMDVTKFVNGSDSSIHETNTVLEIIVPYTTAGRTDITVYRFHDADGDGTLDAGQQIAMIRLATRPTVPFTDNTYFVGDGFIAIYTKFFSAYAIGYRTMSHGGIGGGTTTYTITGEDTVNGKLTVSTKTSAPGKEITITVKPDNGYQLEKLTLTNANGNSIAKVIVNETTYTFIMPASNVTVSAVFTKAGKCPQDETCVYAKFTDSDPKAWYHPGVHFCVEKGYMVGISDKLFAPSGTLSRAMIVTMLWRMEGSPVANYAMSFKDVADGQWYTEAIRWAQSTGVVKGYDEYSFGPNDNVTREQLAAILMRYAAFRGIDVSERADLGKFTDAESISDWALENVKWANAVGMILGRTETTIVPTGNATRAEAANMVQRFCETVLK